MAQQPYPAFFSDGQSARVRTVSVEIDTGSEPRLHIADARGVFMRWRALDLRVLPDQDHLGGRVYYSTDHPDARLVIEDAHAIALIGQVAPNLRKRALASGALRRIGMWVAAAVMSVGLIVFVIIPAIADRLVFLVPQAAEERMGRAGLEQIRWGLSFFDDDEGEIKVCAQDEGVAALEAMRARLMNGVETPHEIKLAVFDHQMVNAFALPGGYVVIFDGLLQKASSPEEVAGVLGHEIGHVVNRDGLRLALRSSGTAGILGLVLGDFTGGAFVLVLTERVISASHSQAAETAADAFAVRVLNGAALPTEPLAGFFDKLGGDEDGRANPSLLSHLASHPDLRQRSAAVKAQGRVSEGFEPVLSEEQWASLKGICDVHGPLPEDKNK